MEITFYPNWGSNPVRWTQSPTLYHVAIKAGLYRKAVQVCYILIPGDVLPLQLEIRPWISRSPRIMWNETQGVLCTHVGYLQWAPNVTGEKMEITFFPNQGSNPVCWTQSLTLYHVAIKAGLYRKAVQVCYILIPGDMNTTCYNDIDKQYTMEDSLELTLVIRCEYGCIHWTQTYVIMILTNK